MALKAKAIQLVERLRQEKTARLKADREMHKVAGKVQVLSDHIEKLMLFLKHEATQKAKAHEQQRRLQKELDLVKARSTALTRGNQAKDRVTIELREGSKILEDQLRLMDEKYMELRTKLDWTRTKADKDVRRARAQASALRTKWALLCTAGGGGENNLLDSINVDPARQNRQSSSAPEVGTGGDYGHYGSSGKLANHSKQQQHQHHGVGQSRGGGSRGSPPIGSRGGLDSRVGRGGGTSGGGAVSRGGAGAMASSTSEPSLFARQHRQQRQKAGGGSGGGLGGAGREAADGQQRPRTGAVGGRSGLLQGGVTFNPGLSAGSDPGGGGDMLAGVRGGSGGGQRPPWSEQGGKVAGGRHAPQLLYA